MIKAKCGEKPCNKYKVFEVPCWLLSWLDLSVVWCYMYDCHEPLTKTLIEKIFLVEIMRAYYISIGLIMIGIICRIRKKIKIKNEYWILFCIHTGILFCTIIGILVYKDIFMLSIC